MQITVVSGKTAPGTTTTTWALALAAGGPVLAVDADPAGGDMAAGLLFGRVPIDQGLLSWATATRRMPALEAAAALAGHVVTLPEAPNVWVLPGFQNAAQAAAMDPAAWDRIARALEREAASLDVVVDAGRLGDSSAWPVIRASDRVLVVCRRSGRSIHAARNAVALLRTRLGDLTRVALVVVDESGSYEPAVIARELDVPLAGELPADRKTATVLSDGAAVGISGYRRAKLVKAARRIFTKLGEESARPLTESVLSR